jgi:dTDP-4-dehydrorhamnose 3,5-epimerase
VLRGLHAQRAPHEQGKLITVLRGEIFDVVVDVTPESPTFGKWISVTLSGERQQQLYVPAGFAHGYQVVSEEAIVTYRCTALYQPQAEITIAWNDAELGITWPLSDPILSEKDRRGTSLADAHGRFSVP